MAYETDLNLKATELRLGLPGTDETEKEKLPGVRNNKRSSSETNDVCETKGSSNGDRETAPITKAKVVGWPPIRSYRKNNFQPKKRVGRSKKEKKKKGKKEDREAGKRKKQERKGEEGKESKKKKRFVRRKVESRKEKKRTREKRAKKTGRRGENKKGRKSFGGGGVVKNKGDRNSVGGNRCLGTVSQVFLGRFSQESRRGTKTHLTEKEKEQQNHNIRGIQNAKMCKC